MKREKERLEQLRNMPYEEYLLTPEWQGTRKVALKRALNRCQVCNAENVDAYHRTYDTRGCEQESDVIVLCGSCSDLFRQRRKGAERDALEPMDEEEETYPDLPLKHKLAVFGGSAALATLGLEVFLHAPLPAEIAALVGAFILAKQSPAIYNQMKEHLPEPAVALLAKIAERKREEQGEREWTTWDRLLGRHMKEQSQGRQQEKTLPAEDLAGSAPSPLDPIFPRYRDDETLRIGQAIDKQALAKLAAAHQERKPLPKVEGRRFEPHIDALYGRGMIIAAAQGSGKSMLLGLLIEQAGACDSPVIIFDHKGEYAPIAELKYLGGLIAGGEVARKKAAKLGAPYCALTTDNAFEFVEGVFARRQQAVVMLPSYGNSWLARAEIVAAVGQALMDYASWQREEEKLLLPCLVVLDEAQLYIPENIRLLPPEARENTKVLGSLSNAFFSLVSNGRSNGFTMCFATQSLTYIGKWAIKSCQIKILMRHVEHNDLSTCEDILGPKAIAKRDDLETMPPGVGVVFNLTPKPMIVQFDTRESRDESETPGVERLRATSAPVTRAPKSKNQGLSFQQIMALYDRGQLDAAQLYLLVSQASKLNTDELEEELLVLQGTGTPYLRVVAHDVSRNVVPERAKIAAFARSDVTRNDRNGDLEAALENGGSPQKEPAPVGTVELPTGWTEKKLAMLPGFYRVLKNLDKALEASEISVSQRNRDFGRAHLRKLGLWKEA
jgi:hypothetical protein